MEGVIPRSTVEKMAVEELQLLYQQVGGIWPTALKQYHWKTRPEKLIAQLEAAGYWGPRSGGASPPAAKKAKAAGGDAMAPPSGTHLPKLRQEVEELKKDTQNLIQTGKLNALDTGAHCKIAQLEQAKGQAGGFGKAYNIKRQPEFPRNCSI